jgi:hypothetical protein
MDSSNPKAELLWISCVRIKKLRFLHLSGNNELITNLGARTARRHRWDLWPGYRMQHKPGNTDINSLAHIDSVAMPIYPRSLGSNTQRKNGWVQSVPNIYTLIL